MGTNENLIQNCEADCPAMSLSSTYSDCYFAGFVGKNSSSGTVENCYDLSFLNVTDSKGPEGSVVAAGFAGDNEGRIKKCYCATAIIANGEAALSYGFAPKGGSVTACKYLNSGSYHFVDGMHDYNAVKNRTSASACSYESLKSQADNVEVLSRNHPNTNDAGGYPFKTVVTDDEGRAVHYGDWVTPKYLGMIGVFYWEHEEKGSNNGYHITYVGVDVTDNKDDVTNGSTLCTAHDDGGIITEFGYGYYIKDDIGTVTINSGESTGIRYSGSNYNTDVSEALKTQMGGYDFYPYTTRYANSGDYIYLDNGEERYGIWSLNYSGKPGKSYVFKLTPFFADAIRIDISNVSYDYIGPEASEDKEKFYNKKPDYSKDPGSIENPFRVRSVDQFRYINWNYEAHNCDTLVYGVEGSEGSGNYKKYPFLQYATTLVTGKQKYNKAYGIDPYTNSSGQSVYSNRVKQYWVQNHDIKALYHGEDRENITPIAGMATSTENDSGKNKNILFAWFGGGYDGQSYKIQNVNVISEAYTVGLFGVVAGANIKNIILYANDTEYEDRAVVKRKTAGADAVRVTPTVTVDFQDGQGAYCIGGLVGMAYEFTDGSSSNSVREIRNCAIAGYRVIDLSTNRQAPGNANVGGLIGLANIDVKNCSAVAEIEIGCTHKKTEKKTKPHTQYGSFVRVGGLAGSAGSTEKDIEVKIENCYTGGSISVLGDVNDPDSTLGELPTDYKENESKWYSRANVNNIYVSGIISGSYAPNVSNFNDKDGDQKDGTARINNCYTYIQLPDLFGTVRAVSLIANKGDRYCRASQIIISNCYYLSTIKDNIAHPKRNDPSTWPKYYFEPAKNRVDWTTASSNIFSRIWERFLNLFGATSGKPPTKELVDAMIADPSGYDDHIAFYGQLVIKDNGDGTYDGTDTGFYSKNYYDKYPNEWNAMLNGNLTCLKSLLYAGHNQKDELNAPESLDYDALCQAAEDLNVSSEVWGYVTTMDGDSRIDGKYTFSSEAAQDGKNYPFPTVIRQVEPKVNVHYGRWPLDGYHWGKGRDTMDLFDDMQESGEYRGWAVKTFYLHYNTVRDTINEDSFTASDKVQILSVETDDANKVYKVRILAKKTGSVTITDSGRKDDQGNIIDQGSGAFFVLNITAKINVTSNPEELTLNRETAQAVTLSAKSNNGRDITEYTQDGRRVWGWSLKQGAESNEDAFTINEDATDYNKYYITGNEAGDRYVEVTFTYNYNKDQGGKSYSSTLFIPARVVGYIGLTSDKVSGDTGTTKVTKTSYRYLIDEHTGTIVSGINPVCPDGPEAFLFGSLGDDDLGGFTIESITVDDGNGLRDSWSGNNNTYSGDHFDVEIKKVTEMGSYNLRPVYIRYKGSDYPQYDLCADITIKLKDPVKSASTEPEIVAKTPAKYTFTIEDIIIPRYAVHFEGGDSASEVMYDIGTQDNTYELPGCTMTKKGYEFAGTWKIGGTDYAPGSTITLNERYTTVRANWTPITYTVVFNANGGMGTMAPMQFVYDVEQNLTQNAFTYTDMKFMGWNTSADGTGRSYADGASVSNLTAKANGTIILYAQWDYKFRIRLINGNTTVVDKPQFSNASRIAIENEPRSDIWTLDGWYTEKSGAGVKILEHDGTLVAGLSNDYFTYVHDGKFAGVADIVLYARWSRTAYALVDELNDASDDGVYLIVNKSDEGSQRVMYTENNAISINYTNPENVGTVTVVEESVYDDTNSLTQAYIADVESITTNMQWNIRFLNEGGLYPIFSIQSKKNSEDGSASYLRYNNGSLSFRVAPNGDQDSTYYGYNNKHVWTYGKVGSQKLVCAFSIEGDDIYYNAIYLDKNVWRANKNTNSCALFRKQTIYTYSLDE
ncbi:MAG: InlB B-repeat-containing protein [Lachnospiraceae bacterium]|nr:InlB B-repeat-containing protein [Lachnospiraceae bacterium]